MVLLQLALCINLKKWLFNNPCERPRPLDYRERTKHILLPDNSKKSKAILFNKSRKWDFPLEVSFSNDEPWICTGHEASRSRGEWRPPLGEKYKLYLQKAMQRMWVLRHMKTFHVDTDHLVDTYTKEIRSLLELAVPVWHISLTKNSAETLKE